jgi:hypothetical protein
MAEPKTKPTAVSPADYIAAIDDPRRREDAEALDAMMRRVSGLEPVMWGPSMIGYGQYHYRYATGHEGDAMRIGFSPRKGQHSLYLLEYCESTPADEQALLDRLGKHKRGKSCLYVANLADVDMAVLEHLAERSWTSMATRYPD